MSTPTAALPTEGSTPGATTPATHVDVLSRMMTPAVVALGCGALAARGALVDATPHPTRVLVMLFCGLLIAGVSLRTPGVARGELESRVARNWTVVVLVAVAAFAAGRALVGGHAPMPFSGYAVATSTLAAVAEEAWFRRLCFGLLIPAGPAFAICGSTLLFAVVHVATYGWWVLPLDLAAGALLGWQRAVTGSWTAPAVTHVIANLLVLR